MNSIWNKLSEYIYTFTYQKALLHTRLLLVFEVVESLQCILNTKLPNRYFNPNHEGPLNLQKIHKKEVTELPTIKFDSRRKVQT